MRKLAVALVTLLAVANTTPAEAQSTSQQRLHAAQRELRNVDRSERFDLAARHCREALDERQGAAAATWCQAASQEADEAHTREHREYSNSEADLLRDAAWLVAVKGVQERAASYSRPRLRGTPGDTAADLRLYAYQLLGDIRCGCSPSTSLPVLLFSVGVPPADYQTYSSGREQAFGKLLAQQHTPETLWAAAALAHTVAIDVNRDDNHIRAEARATATILAPLIEEARDLPGRDAALAPLLTYAYGLTLSYAGDLQGALPVLESGTVLCDARLWPSADACLDMALEAARVRETIAAQALDPDWSDLVAPSPISRPAPGFYNSDEPCSALLVGDLDASGSFVNARIAYASAEPLCRTYAEQYASGLRYVPIDQSKPDERRHNILVRLTVLPE
jgi:hypothetical protein